MRLLHEFYRLPLRFDARRMLEEVQQFDLYQWTPDRFAVPGYWSLNLISYQGGNSENQDAPMRATPFLDKCPYLRQVLTSFDTPYAEVRLRWLGPGAEVKEHFDMHYAWFRRLRFHIPIVTNPDVQFVCDDQQVQMAAGDAWLFDRRRPHRVVNKSGKDRIHLIMDTPGSESFNRLLARSQTPGGRGPEPELVSYQPSASIRIETEQTPFDQVMKPEDVDVFLEDLIWRLTSATVIDTTRGERLLQAIERFRREWRTAWSAHGPKREQWAHFVEIGTRLYLSYLEIERASRAPFTEKNAFLRDRIARFLVTGAVNPQFGTNSRQVMVNAAARFDLDESVLFRLRGESLERQLSRKDEYIPSTIDEIALLSEVPKAKCLAEVAEAIGVECDSAFFEAVRQLVRDGVLAQYPETVFQLPIDSPVEEKPLGAESTPASHAPSTSVDPKSALRHSGVPYIRLFRNGILGLWVPTERHYREVDPAGLLLLAGIASAGSPERAAEQMGIHFDNIVLNFISELVELGVLERL